MTKPRKVRCPQCGQDALWAPENPWRPFCSERCKQIDLGAWANESYRIAGKSTDDEMPGTDFPETRS
ncbi:DNA gyrase inhibitor YacG [Azonexus sp. R2A-61]|uniref:DNA gyrase inhibitor YacG n=1 Tax=Azonexus sp. R2A61 TaxID=2744443 RepID=UPI001F27BE9F